jgi:hypothetical protein
MQGDGVAVPGEIAGQVAAHHAKAGDADLRCLGHLVLLSSNRLFVAAGCTPAAPQGINMACINQITGWNLHFARGFVTGR